ncbi:MAG: hypothetical protein LC105_08380, partial [Chitinophagales bacterium]|nr:hypothetical protein [Chitinophagales bacterium]
MRRYLLNLLLISIFGAVNILDLSAQTIEMQIQVDEGSIWNGSSCNACGATSPDAYSRLRYVFGSTTGEGGFRGSVGCGAYTNATPTTTLITSSTQSYGTSATIQLYAEDLRSCGIQDIGWTNASGGTTSINPTGINPGETYTAQQTSTATGGTSTVGMRWKARWRYVAAGTAGTLSDASGGSGNYCKGSTPVTLSLTGSDVAASYKGVVYEWRSSANGYGSVLATSKDYSTPGSFPSITTTYRRIAKYQNNYSNASPTYVTSQVDITINIANPPSGNANASLNVCTGNNVTFTIPGWNGGTGTPTVYVRDPYGVNVDTTNNANISFPAPDISPANDLLISYSVIAAPGSPVCDSVNLGTLNVHYYQGSTAPSSIEVSPSTTICEGDSVLLTAKGAKLGYGGARYEWSDSSNFSSILYFSTTDSTYQTGAISSAKTYYVRIGNISVPGGVCPSTTSSISQSISVVDSSTSPTSISAIQDYFCQGSLVPISLTQVGGSLGTGANWQWSTEPTFTTGVLPGETNNSLSVLPGSGNFPAATTTYYVRATNNTSPCDTSSGYASFTLNFSTLSEDPGGVTNSTGGVGVCAGTSITLTVDTSVSGSLGAGAQWVWYQGGCASGASIGTGASIIVSPSTTTAYYVRAEGDCNNSACASSTAYIFEPAVDPDSISIAPIHCIDFSENVTATVMGGTLGTGMQWYWYTDTLTTSFATGDSVTFNLTSYEEIWVRAESDSSLGSIPAPCPATTTPISFDMTSLIYEVTPELLTDMYVNGGVDVYCDNASFTITVEGDLTAYQYDYSIHDYYTITSPIAQYLLYDEDPSLNPSAVAIDSNQTGVFNLSNVTTTTTYYGLVENICGTSDVLSVTITVNYSSTAPTSATADIPTICNGANTNVTITAN